MPAQVRHHWTADAVRELQDESRPAPRYELIAGELVVTPAPEASHQAAVAELLRTLEEFCVSERLGVALQSPADIELVEEWITQPDVFVVPNALLPADDTPMKWSRITSLLLAVEVLSPSSVRIDRVEKRDHYLSSGVDEYWIVDLDARHVEQWHAHRPTPTLARESLTWRPDGARGELNIDLPRFFATVRGKLRQR